MAGQEAEEVVEIKTDELTVEELVCELEESKKLTLEYLDHLQRLQAGFKYRWLVWI
ncbi:MAG: hypothetical protein KAJ93_05070 [Methanosarcinales archaeon]|nr:hypothetical protein [Methanosarcinales archaeon]